MPVRVDGDQPSRPAPRSDAAMDQQRPQHEEAATSVDEPTGTPPDEGLAYDPEMTDTDEANVPEGSDADPQA
jgi:hypothetical protein